MDISLIIDIIGPTHQAKFSGTLTQIAQVMLTSHYFWGRDLGHTSLSGVRM